MGNVSSCTTRGRKVTVSSVLVLLCCLFSTQAGQLDAADITYSKVNIFISSESEMRALNEAGVVLDHPKSIEGGVEVVLNEHEVNWLEASGVSYDIVVPDLEAEFNARPKLSDRELKRLEDRMRSRFLVPSRFELGSQGGYYTADEIIAQLDEMFADFPGICTQRQSIGTSIEGEEIWMVKISDNPNVDENEEEILYTAIMHAREPQAMASVIYFMFHLLENYGSDPTITFLVDNRELYFVPLLNPDGFRYNEQTNPNGGGFWRKNRRDNGGGSFGVDINRNFDFEWAFDNNGSSPNPNSGTYRGTAPASEPETQALQDFVIAREFTMAFNHHSVAGSYNFPWGYRPNFFTPDHNQFVAYSQTASLFDDFRFGTPWQNLGYVTNGYSNDWFYGEQSAKDLVFSWTLENDGSGFWPQASDIFGLCELVLYGNLSLAWGVNGAPPACDVTITPANPPVVLPPGGGQIPFNLEITNTSGVMIDIDYFTFAERVGAGTTDPLKSFSATLDLGESIDEDLTQFVPSVDPGSFNYHVQINASASGTNINTASFPFTVAVGPSGTTAGKSDVGESWRFDNDGGSALAELPAAAVIPRTLSLDGNYPNPFNPETRIVYSLPNAQQVKIRIFDITGRLVRELVNRWQTAGRQSVRWDGKDLNGTTAPSGVYLYRMEAGDFVATNKMLLVK